MDKKHGQYHNTDILLDFKSAFTRVADPDPDFEMARIRSKHSDKNLSMFSFITVIDYSYKRITTNQIYPSIFVIRYCQENNCGKNFIKWNPYQ